jgi:hypothetical protein
MRAEHFDRDLLLQCGYGNIVFFQDNGIDVSGGNTGAPFPDYYSLNSDNTRNYIDYGEEMSRERTAVRLGTNLYFCVPPNVPVNPPFTFQLSPDGYKRIMFGWDNNNSNWSSQNPDPDTLEVEVKFFVKPFGANLPGNRIIFSFGGTPDRVITLRIGDGGRISIFSGGVFIASSIGTAPYNWGGLINNYVEIGARFKIAWDTSESPHHWDLVYFVQWRFWGGTQWNFRSGKATLSGRYHNIPVSATSKLWGDAPFVLGGDGHNRPYGFFRCKQGAGVFSDTSFWQEGGAT